MSVIILLIIFSLLLAIGFLFSFIWSVRDGQMDDDYTPSVRMLYDTNPPAENHLETGSSDTNEKLC
jgi:cbb3-type cytochrome oxidase maturation protein